MAPPPMWKLHRYYLKEVTVSSVLTFTVLFGIALIAMVSRGIDRAQGGNLMSALMITFFWAADTIPHLLAMALLIATVMTFARASQDREITAIRASGISPRVPMVAALIVGLLFSILGSLALHWVIPWAHYNKFRVVGEAVRNFIMNTKMAGGKLQLGSFMLSAAHQDAQGHLYDVVLRFGKGQALNGGLDPGKAYIAREAWIELSPDGETIGLVVKDLRDAATVRLEGPMHFDINLRSISERNLRWEGDKDLTTDQLLAEVRRGVHENPGGAHYTVHRRACFSVMPALFAPIGFCLGVLARDRGRTVALLFALAPLVLFYGCTMVAPALLRLVNWPALAWLPAVVIGLLGLPLCWRWMRF